MYKGKTSNKREKEEKLTVGQLITLREFWEVQCRKADTALGKDNCTNKIKEIDKEIGKLIPPNYPKPIKMGNKAWENRNEKES